MRGDYQTFSVPQNAERIGEVGVQNNLHKTQESSSSDPTSTMIRIQGGAPMKEVQEQHGNMIRLGTIQEEEEIQQRHSVVIPDSGNTNQATIPSTKIYSSRPIHSDLHATHKQPIPRVTETTIPAALINMGHQVSDHLHNIDRPGSIASERGLVGTHLPHNPP